MQKKSTGRYFTQETEDAIVLYNSIDDPEEKNKVYEKWIHGPFFKLTQNLIHTFKFYYIEETSIEDLQHEVITFLLTKLHRFDPTNGAKAYSYFGTVAKRYLIASNQKNYKKRVEFTSINALHTEQEEGIYMQGDVLDQIDDTFQEPNRKSDPLDEFLEAYLQYCYSNLNQLFPKLEHRQTADAILTLFKKRDTIDMFNKKALYIYIREIVDVKTSKITKIAKILGNIYKKNYRFYLENGYVNF